VPQSKYSGLADELFPAQAPLGAAVPTPVPLGSEPSPNKYAGIRDQLDIEDEARFNVIQQAARTVNPDLRAKAAAFGRANDLPVTLAEQHLKNLGIRGAAPLVDFAAIRRDSPTLADWASQPDNAALAHDDYENLGAVEKTLRYTGAAVRSLASGMTARFAAGLAGMGENIAHTVNISTYYPQIKAPHIGTDWRDEFKASRQFFERAASEIEGQQTGFGWLGDTALGIPASLGQMAPGMIFGMFTGSPLPALTAMGVTTAGQAFGQGIDAGLSPLRAMVHSDIQGLLETGTEIMPVHALFQDLADKAAFWTVLKHQFKTELPNEIAATATENLNDFLTYHPDRPLSEYLSALPEAEAQTIIQTLGIVVASGGFAHVVNRVVGTSESQRAATALHAAADASKLKERSQPDFSNFAQSVADHVGIEPSVPLAATIEYFQKKGVNPEAAITALTGDPEAFQRASASGDPNAEIVIPVGNYLSHVPGSGHEAFFESHVRFGPYQQNAVETKADLETQQAAATEPVQPTPQEAIRTNIAAQLVATGRVSEATARTQATVLAEAFPVLAQRAGVPLDALLRQWLPQIVAGNAPVPGALEQAAHVDMPAFKAWFGESQIATTNGAPQVVYHGTADNVESFDLDHPNRKDTGWLGTGVYLTTDPNLASSYAMLKPGRANEQVLPLYARLTNPYHATLADKQRLQLISHNEGAAAGRAASDAWTETLKAQGYDGVVLEYDAATVGAKNASREIVVFDPAGVKSATGNVGTYDPSNPNILYQQPASAPVFFSRLTKAIESSKQGKATGAQWKAQLKNAGVSAGEFDLTRVEDLANGTTYTKQEVLDYLAANQVVVKDVTLGAGPAIADIGRLQDELDATDAAGLAQPAILITPDLAQAVQQGQPLFQGARGSIQFPHGTVPIIRIFSGVNRSTMFHEPAHLFSKMLFSLADTLSAIEPTARTPEQQQLIDDAATLRAEYPGADHPDIQVSEKPQEGIARGFEAYVMKGEAPSAALRAVFARAARWLTALYRNLAGLSRDAGFQVTLSPQVKAVFDRMLATDDAIKAAQQEVKLEPLFTAAMATVHPEEFAGYQDKIRAAGDEARSTLQTLLMKDILSEDDAFWRAERERVAAEATAQVGQEPVYAALAAIRTGLKADGSPLTEGAPTVPLKLSKADLVAQFGADILKRLPKPYVYARDGGVPADLVASLFGFEDGKALVDAIVAAPHIDEAIADRTEQMLRARHGEIGTDPTTIAEEATKAVISTKQQDVIRAELGMLRKLQADAAPSVKAAKAGDTARANAAVERLRAVIYDPATLAAWAHNTILAMPLKLVSPARYLAVATRAAGRAVEAAAKNEFDTAVSEKQSQLANLALFTEAQALRDSVDAARTAYDKMFKADKVLAKTHDMDLVNAARFLAARYFWPTRTRLTTATEALALVDKYDPETAKLLKPIIDDLLAKAPTLATMTGAQFADFHEAVTSLWTMSSKAETDRIAARELAQSLADSIAANTTARPEQVEIRTTADLAIRSFEGKVAAHSRLSTLVRALDGGVVGGPVWEAIERPINAASDAKQERNVAAGKALWAVVTKRFPGGRLTDLNHTVTVQLPSGRALPLSLEGRLAIALNFGTATGQDRVRSDKILRLTQADAEAVLDTLTQQDWEYVKDVWAFIGQYGPEIAALEHQVSGVRPKMVTGVTIQTKFGPVQGAYYPLKYDSRKDAKVKKEALDLAKASLGSAYGRQQTKDGFTEARRAHVELPLRLDMGVMFRHVDEVIHYLTHRQMLMDVSRIVQSGAFKDAVYTAKGDQVYQQLNTMLTDLAAGSLPGGEHMLDDVAQWLKGRVQTASLGLNIWTMVQQPSGLMNGMEEAGVVPVLRGLRSWLASPLTMDHGRAFVASKSALMRHRIKGGLTPELHELKNAFRVPGGWFDTLLRTVTTDKVTQQTLIDGLTWHIGLAQQVADIPTWLGAYEKYLALDPTDDARAVALADQAVLDSQGGDQIKDMAGVQRGRPLVRAWLMFYSYGNMLLNQNMRAVGRTDFAIPSDVVKLMGSLLLINIGPAIWTLALGNLMGRIPPPDDDEGWAQWTERWLGLVAKETLSGALNGIVLVREATAALTQGNRGYEGPAFMSLMVQFYRAGQQVEQGVVDDALVKAVVGFGERAIGFPAVAADRIVSGYHELAEGRTKNPLVLLTGAPKAR